MAISAYDWQARAALCELLALSFYYPEDGVLAEAVVSGEWGEAAEEIASALNLDWKAGTAPGAAEAAAFDDSAELEKALRVTATRLFVGAPQPEVSPYEGIWRAKEEGVQGLLFVNPHSMDVERFCKACGLGRPEGTNEPLDSAWTELELLEYLALRAASDAFDAEEALEDVEGAPAIAAAVQEDLASFEGAPEVDGAEAAEPADDTCTCSEDECCGEHGDECCCEEDKHHEEVASADLPGGSPAAAYDQFMKEHALRWMPQFCDAVIADESASFYRTAASLLSSVCADASNGNNRRCDQA
jgi:TorA maturation chaperone TorD